VTARWKKTRRSSRLPPVALLAYWASLSAVTPEQWLRLVTPHFELLTTASEHDGREALSNLERLRRFFHEQAALPDDVLGGVRIVAFRSPQEYAPYRLSKTADAYNVGYGSRDYVVMPSLGIRSTSIAAHEYAHVVARRQGFKPPLWLSEGLAEVFSTISFQSGRASVGAPKPATLKQLRSGRWLPLDQLMEARDLLSFSREQTAMFYAESWALADMLMLSPAHLRRLKELLAGRMAPTGVSAKPPDELERDLRAWVMRSHLPLAILPDGGGSHEPAIRVESMTRGDARLALAELLSASGMLEKAETAWRELEILSPGDPRVQAALGRLALARGNAPEARERYGRAVAMGIRDAQLCFDYASLARDAGFPEGEVMAAFERALALDPTMDDACYNLALMHMNAGRYGAALSYFQAMRHVSGGRAFAYYISLAHTQNELGMRDAAARSAAEAHKHARTDEDRTLADELAWTAASEVVVQLSPLGPGRLRRIPLRRGREHDEANPFIAPGDRIERVEGTLQDVDCSGKGLRLTVLTGAGIIVVSVPDPGLVQVRKAGAGSFEFTCGPQQGSNVLVEYAAAADSSVGVAGILRGIELH
jgi:tetratricopeptide (TPR) repeat protein